MFVLGNRQYHNRNAINYSPGHDGPDDRYSSESDARLSSDDNHQCHRSRERYGRLQRYHPHFQRFGEQQLRRNEDYQPDLESLGWLWQCRFRASDNHCA